VIHHSPSRQRKRRKMVGFVDSQEAVPMDYYPAHETTGATKSSNANNFTGLPPLAPRGNEESARTANQEIGPASSYEDDEETDGDELLDKESVKRWDEGGPSDCGYSNVFHETLMSVGSKIHDFVGAPSGKVQKLQDSIGNWFQELSYATRDIVRGENTDDMHKDAADAVSNLFYGKEEDDDKESEPAALVIQPDP
jgi:hypothetical protein